MVRRQRRRGSRLLSQRFQKFPPSRELRSPDEKVGPKGKLLTISFELDGQKFTALNGGPTFKFTEAISFVVRCEDQAEMDYYWSKLTAGGGSESQCGWLKDKFGLSWQVAPERFR